MDGLKSNAGGFEYKIDEVNVAKSWNPEALTPEEMGGFNFGTEDKILRWLHHGDTIYDVANKFYTDECEGVYDSVSNFQKEIKEQNNINKFSSFVKVGDTIEVPVIVNKDNPYYVNIIEIQNEITNIETNNLWVKYTVEKCCHMAYNKEKSCAGGTDYGNRNIL